MKIQVSQVFRMAVILLATAALAGCGGTKHVLTTAANDGIIYCGAMIDASKGYAVGDDGRTFAKEEQIKLPNIAKAICFNRTNGISVYNTDCTMDFYQLRTLK